MAKKTQAPQPLPKELQWIETVTNLLDSTFRIPFTNISFGLDPILGLAPGIGDVISFGISSLIILTVVKHGVSAQLAMRMVGNLIIDTAMGSVPVAGDLLDFFVKSNQRNLKLLRVYYAERSEIARQPLADGSYPVQMPEERGAWPAVIAVGALLVVVGGVAIYGMWSLLHFLWQLLSASF